jgi:hypothetical protein
MFSASAGALKIFYKALLTLIGRAVECASSLETTAPSGASRAREAVLQPVEFIKAFKDSAKRKIAVKSENNA